MRIAFINALLHKHNGRLQEAYEEMVKAYDHCKNIKEETDEGTKAIKLFAIIKKRLQLMKQLRHENGVSTLFE